MRTGWCLTKDCDTETTRGGCPIQVGSTPACDCPCHEGQTAGRGYLPIPTAKKAWELDEKDDE